MGKVFFFLLVWIRWTPHCHPNWQLNQRIPIILERLFHALELCKATLWEWDNKAWSKTGKFYGRRKFLFQSTPFKFSWGQRDGRKLAVHIEKASENPSICSVASSVGASKRGSRELGDGAVPLVTLNFSGSSESRMNRSLSQKKAICCERLVTVDRPVHWCIHFPLNPDASLSLPSRKR